MPAQDRTLSLNERRLVELVFRSGQIARVDLTEATDMTAASVTRLISGLEDVGLFKQNVKKDGTRGQPKRLLSLRKDRFRAIGVYLYHTRIEAVLVDFSGQVLATRSHPLTRIAAGDVAQVLTRLTTELLTETKTAPDAFLGVGLGLPGNFGTTNAHLQAHEVFAGLNGSAIHESLVDQSAWPVYLENDGTAAALGEYLFGNHPAADPLFLVHIGYGLGGGAVLGGRPYRGLNGNACLPGALFPYSEPRPTLLDLENHLAAHGLTLDSAASASPTPAPLIDWLDRATTQMTLAVRLITGMFDPALIVLGGALPHTITQAMADRLSAMQIDGPSRGLQTAPVVATSLGALNGPVGAASIPFFRRFFPGSTVERGNAYLDGRIADKG